MSRRDPRRARVLGLWTAGWLAVFLLAGILRLGDLAVQWPVLAVPLVWALVALRPRRRPAWEVEPASDDGWDDDPAEEWLEDYREDERPDVVQPGYRTDTVERPAVRRPSWDDRGDGRRRG